MADVMSKGRGLGPRRGVRDGASGIGPAGKPIRGSLGPVQKKDQLAGLRSRRPRVTPLGPIAPGLGSAR